MMVAVRRNDGNIVEVVGVVTDIHWETYVHDGLDSEYKVATASSSSWD